MSVREYKLYINDEFRDASDSRTFTSINPFNQQTIATFARAGVVDTQAAIRAAREAFDNGPWPRLSPRRTVAIHQGNLRQDQREQETPRRA